MLPSTRRNTSGSSMPSRGAARAGEVLVSQEVVDASAGVEVTFTEIGAVELKGHLGCMPARCAARFVDDRGVITFEATLGRMGRIDTKTVPHHPAAAGPGSAGGD